MRRQHTQTMPVCIFVVVLMILCLTSAAAALTDEQGDAILREMQDIKSLLQTLLSQRNVGVNKGPARDSFSPGAKLSIAGKPVKGKQSAKVTVVEFSDYQCPFCARHFRETLPQLDEEYIKTGKVQYVFKDFPLEQIHPNAVRIAEVMNCAARQGKYWKLHDFTFTNQNSVERMTSDEYAAAADLDAGALQTCINDAHVQDEIREDMNEGRRLSVWGTPTFFIGLTDVGSSHVKALHMLRGAQPYEQFKAIIEPLLKDADSDPQSTHVQ